MVELFWIKSVFIVLVNKFPAEPKLAVMPESYVLGLLDCVGELKRKVFDEMRTGDIDEAIRFFEVMENLYLQLYPMIWAQHRKSQT